MRHNANKHSKRAWAAILLVFTVQTTLANPLGPSVVNGQASFATAGNTLTVTNTPGTIINWQGFSIGANEITRFAQQNASSAVLNRVVSSNPSSILGSLQSNGRVFLVNPNGIVFGQGATVDVAGLVATSLNLGNADFLAGRYNFTDVPGAQSVSNAGNLAAQGDGLRGGQIYLIAPNVENSGIITAPNGEILLAAGHSVDLVNSIEPNLRVNITAPAGDATNIGQLIAESGSLGLFGAVVRNSGTVSADSATTQGGKVVFKASQRAEISGTATATGTTGGTVHALGSNQVVLDGNASIDASGTNGGGTVLIGGDAHGANPAMPNAQHTFVGANTTLKADAVVNGDGGNVIVWANDTTQAYGNISARGGQQGGDGGFVETSGGWLDVLRGPDVSASLGKGGTWLLDPYDITITAATANSSTLGVNPITYTPTASGSTIDAGIISGTLDGGVSVIVDTSLGGAEAGNITVNSPLNTVNAGAATLTLKAHNDIVINAPLSMNNSLVLTANQDATGGGNVVINKSVTAAGTTASGQDIIFASLDGGTTYGKLNGGAVSLTATGGAITPSPYGFATEVAAQSLTMTAVNGIGNGGKVFVADVLGTIQFANTNNAVNIYNSSAGAGRIFTGSNTNGPIRLESFDSTDATTVGNLTSGGGITLKMNNLTTGGAAAINAGANTVYLSPYTISPVPGISIGGADSFNLTGADISRITAGKIIIGNDSFGNIAPTVNIATGSAVSVTNAANLEIWGGAINTGATGFSNAGGQIALIGDAMSLAGPVSSGSVSLRGKTFSQNIDLGGVDTAGTLGLTDAELDQITANILRIGYFLGSGNINVSAAISPANATTISLESGGGITQGAPGVISATNLAIKAGGHVVLDTAPNVVTNLAAQVSGSASNFSFQNAGALNIATGIDGLSGISMPGFVNPGGVIALSTVNGNIGQSVGALLAGSSVQAVAGTGSSVLLNADNPTGVIAGSADGSFSYNSINGIAVTTVGSSVGIQAGSNVTLNAGSAGINQNAPILALANISLSTPGSSAINSSMTAATINIQSPGGIMLGTASSLTAGGVATIILNAGTGSFVNNSSAGAAALNAPSSRWLVYAASPANVVKGGLVSDFRHYGATYATYNAPTEPGNGFIYASTPGVLSVDTTLVSGTARHIYGATPTAQFGYAIGNPTSADNEDLLLIAGTPAFNPAPSSITPAGSYTVTYLGGLTSSAGYTFTPGTGLLYVIDPATLAIITASLTGTAGKTYDGTNTAPLAPGNFLLSGFVNGDDAIVTKTTGTYDSPNVGSGILVSTTLAATDFTPVGSTNLANYTLPTSASGPIGNITPASLTVAANPDSKVYDGTAYSGGNGASYSGLMNGETAAVLGGTLAYGGTSQGAVNAGSYLITPSGLTSSNYTIGYVDGTLTITPAALGLMSVTANDASKTYGDTLTFTGTEFTPAGLLGGDTISGVTLTSPGAADTANAGIYAITPSNAVFSVGNAGNYTISYVDGQLTVNPAPLMVTADALSKAAGNPDPLLTYTTAGLKLADTTATTLSGELARLAGETAGAYPINQGTLSLLSSNYTMSYVPADFSIISAPSTVVNELVNDIVVAPPDVPFEPPASPEPAQTPAADADDEENKDDEAAAVVPDGTPANETATAAAPLPVCK